MFFYSHKTYIFLNLCYGFQVVTLWNRSNLAYFFIILCNTMSIGKYLKREKPSTSAMAEPIPMESGVGDMEKAHHASYVDGVNHTPQQHVDPEVEKRVVRKLDRNIIPLVMTLCKLSSHDPSRD
jgi:hypothetical protein